MAFKNKLNESRLAERFSQSELASKIGVHEKHVTKMENSNTIPSAETLIKISETFNVSVDYLLFNDVPKHSDLGHLSDPDLANLIFQDDNLSENDRKVIKETVNALLTRSKVQSILKPEKCPYNKKRKP